MTVKLYDCLACAIGLANERLNHLGRPGDAVRCSNRADRIGDIHDFTDYENVAFLARSAAAEREGNCLASIRWQEVSPQSFVLSLSQTQSVVGHGLGSRQFPPKPFIDKREVR